MTKIADQLIEQIPRECISEKQGLSYVSHRYVKSQLNAIFGWHGWSYEVVRVDLDRPNMGAFVHVRLTVMGPEGPVIKDGLAFGFAAGQTSNQAYDFAIAEGVTDAIKRAAVSLGERLGLELYPMHKGGSVPQPGPPKAEPPSAAEVKDVKHLADMIGECTQLSGLNAVAGLIKSADLGEQSKESLRVLYLAKKTDLGSSDE